MEKDLKIFTNNIESKALAQTYYLMEQAPFKDQKVRIMPDAHFGKGSVVGFTATMGDKIIPNVVGVDIGCGMLTVKLGKLPSDQPNLDILDACIRRSVPSGFSIHQKPVSCYAIYDKLLCYNELTKQDRFNRSIGTLGGGNHFIELDKDKDDNYYLVIHSGSRDLGKQVAIYYQQLAISKINKDQKLMNDDVCYLEGEDKDAYINDMQLCQKWASYNRKIIARSILEDYFNSKVAYEGNLIKIKHQFFKIEAEWFETIHNYINLEDNIIRKGAISAKKDEIVLIPMNMRDGSILAKGKGNEDWNNSAPHGAGRILSRSEAKNELNIEDYQESMKGIFSTSVKQSTIDESPMVYKSMNEIIANTQDTIEILDIIKPVYNYKAN